MRYDKRIPSGDRCMSHKRLSLDYLTINDLLSLLVAIMLVSYAAAVLWVSC